MNNKKLSYDDLRLCIETRLLDWMAGPKATRKVNARLAAEAVMEEVRAALAASGTLTDEQIEEMANVRSDELPWGSLSYREGLSRGAKWARSQIAAGTEPTMECPKWLRDDLEGIAADCEAGHPDYYTEGWQEVGRSIRAVLALFRKSEARLAGCGRVLDPKGYDPIVGTCSIVRAHVHDETGLPNVR